MSDLGVTQRSALLDAGSLVLTVHRDARGAP
jgi:hypothetical protein